MNKFKVFFNKLQALTKKAGTAIAKVAKKTVKVVVANQAKSIVIGSVAALVVGGGVTTIIIVGNKDHEHTPNAAIIENYVAPTCKTGGNYDEVVYCADCVEEISRVAKTVANLTTHTPTDWITDKAATCKVTGEKHKECAICNQVLETGVIELIDHTEAIDSAVAPTCTKTGLTEGKHCSVCDEVIAPQQLLAEKGHTDENNDFLCDICETELCTNHTEATIPAVKPTCTTNGLTEGKKCSVCGDILVPQTSVSASGHTSGNTVVENKVDPDCENSGSYDNVVYCSECDTELLRKTITVDKLGHNYNSTFVPPTATEDGYTEHHCPACEDTYKDSYVTPIAFEVTSSNRSKFGYTGEKNENLVIPAVFEDNGTWYRVTSIGDHAFGQCYNLTSVVIPDSVTSIGDFAFYRCPSLTGVVIPDSVTSIGRYAFYNCDRLTSVVIGDSVTSIGTHAFYSCGSLTSVVIGDSVTSIGDDAFNGCTSLTSVVIPDSVTTIGDGAFYHCDSLTDITVDENNQSYMSFDGNLYSKDGKMLIQYAIGKTESEFIIPDSVTSIGYGAFYHCRSLTSVAIPDSVTSIGSSALSDCDNLTDITVDENNQSYMSIDGNLYSKDGKILIQYAIGKSESEFIIPNSVTIISEWAFGGCYSLTSVVIPDSVTSIGYFAFYSCDRLTSVVIGNSVTNIGNAAFYSCDRLTDVYYTGTQAEWEATTISSLNSDLTSATIHYNYVPEE